MIPKDCKRLAEVDFPIAEVSRHAVREKSIRHGHPSALHLWWARRPLASSRAVLFALLMPDPCDPLCPLEFKAKARTILQQIFATLGPSDSELRQALLKYVGSLANWEICSNRTYLDSARALVAAAYGDEKPLVVDPFAGGGAIPLEALRLNCDVLASDLNPVACTLLKIMLEDLPRRGPELIGKLRHAGAEVRRNVAPELTAFYPPDADGAVPIAYIWARTVACEAPKCGAEIPLMRSFWLCNKARRKRALRYHVKRGVNTPTIQFEIFEPENDSEVPPSTVTRAKATCLACGTVLSPDRVRSQLRAQRGGADVLFDSAGQRIGGARMLAAVTLHNGTGGRRYRLPALADYAIIREAQLRLTSIVDTWAATGRLGLSPVPDEPTPEGGGSGAGRAFSVRKYGMQDWGDLFTARQKIALIGLASQVAAVEEQDAGTARLLAIALDKTADLGNALAPWKPDAECPVHLFARQVLPMAWDFAEAAPIGDASGSFESAYERSADALTSISGSLKEIGQCQLNDAAAHPLPDQSAAVWFSDPPYYDAVPYADLSDFFFVWLKRALPSDPMLRDPFDSTNQLTPKRREAVQDETKHDGSRPKNRAWFEETMACAFAEGHRVLQHDGIGAVVFAHKTTEGWEALLSGMIRGGWTITGSWPIATEMGTRLRARDSAALATSVHLICRPRSDDMLVGDWEKALRELPRRVGDWMEHLQSEGVRGADLVFACIGPALEIFSRYARVETAEGREVALAEYLEKVWEVVGRSALKHVLGTAEARARNGAAGAVEEDARLTALFLWTIQTTNGELEPEIERGGAIEIDEDGAEALPGARSGYTLIFDVVRRFAQPLGINLAKWDGRIIETKKGIVRLLPVGERARQLFGADGAQAVATRLEAAVNDANPLQGVLFPEMKIAPRTPRKRRGVDANGPVSDESLVTASEATTLDRLHAAMLLQAGGRTNALRALLKSEQERSPDFLRLANALTALYPKASEEKRLLDAMLLAVPR